jgi:hypothetical protein
MLTRGVPIGCGGLLLVAAAVFLFGGDPQQLLEVLEQTQGPSAQVPAGDPSAGGPGGAEGGTPSDELGRFAAVVLADTEDTWHELFAKSGGVYEEPRLVLFSGAVESECGYASSQVGPFYCPGDRKGYIDLIFFQELAQSYGAPGDFAQAYVIAHEVGHHVQTLLGITQRVGELRDRQSEADANALSVRVELQADCFAGLWAHHANRARQVLEAGDVEEALGAASAIGDDRLQRQGQGYVVPDSFTHGSSAQRVRWFRAGLDSGGMQACDTFNADTL